MDRIDAHVVGVIKPLVWEDLGAGYWCTPAPLFGSIRVEPWGDRGFQVLWSVPGVCDRLIAELYETPDAAKASAEADYIARLRSQIAPVSVPEDVTGLVRDLRAWPASEAGNDGFSATVVQELMVSSADTIEALAAEITGYREWGGDVKRLTRQIDVDMHGEEGAAKQASLCDLVGAGVELRRRAEKADAALARLIERDKMLTEAFLIAGPIALDELGSHPFVHNAEERRQVDIITAALADASKG